jgi:5-methyltetrahydrofolate--homocysteine methyltransferase
MVMPNAGMPELIDNRAVYKMTPKRFGEFAAKFAKLGVRIIGGCCGTGPEHISAIANVLKPETERLGFNKTEPRRLAAGSSKFASRTKVVEVKEGIPLLVGERINPTGRKLFQEEIKSGRTQILRTEATQQSKAGADLLDVNISVPDTIESEKMETAIKLVQNFSAQPLSIDSPNYAALETGLKLFCGKGLLNSVNGKKDSIERVIPLAKKYGSAIIALVLDETGLPKNASERMRIAERLVMAASEAGIPKQDIYIDNLVLTAGVGIQGCLETLKAIPMVKQKLGVKTILGISNVSHGLPNRSKLNALYFKLALSYGLDAAIIDVTDPEIKKILKDFGELSRAGIRRPKKGKKADDKEALFKAFKAEVERARRSGKPAEKKREVSLKEIRLSGYSDFRRAVIYGDLQLVERLVTLALEKKYDPQKIINQGLVPGMEVVGKKFSRKEYYLPQVIEAAEAMQKGFEICQARIPKEKIKVVGKVILATVKGDIHDIGKNIVKMLLVNHGFEVIDLGKDVPPEKIIEAAKREKPNVIALSALLTTTMVEMGVVKEELKKANLNIPLLVGGAVVTKGYADRIGAAYCMDAVGAVALARRIMKEAGRERRVSKVERRK